MAKECVNQCFQFNHNPLYVPLENIKTEDLDAVLKDRLGFSFSAGNVQTMSQLQLGAWYGGDGVENAFGQLKSTLFGSQIIKKEEDVQTKHAERVLSKKRKAPKDGHAEEPAAKHSKKTSSESGSQSEASKSPDASISTHKKTSKLPAFKKGKDKAPAKILVPDSDDIPQQICSSKNSSRDGSVSDIEESPSPPPTPK